MYNEQAAFSAWIAEMYDRDETDLRDAALLLTLLGPAPKRVLEAACGSGRLLLPLAEAGHLVTGFDLDERMLDRLAAKAAGRPGLRWARRDALKDDWGGGYDAVLLAANLLLNLVTETGYADAQALLIRRAADALAPGGHLYLDYDGLPHPERRFCHCGERIIWQGTDSAGSTGKMSLLDGTYDPETGLARFTRLLELRRADGTALRQKLPSVKHYAAPEQVRHWLRAAGLHIEAEYGGYDRRPLGADADRAIFWARRDGAPARHE